MRYSGLIYAAIVACWAAVLVPRWIRRNEEVEHAREEDAARGVRVIERERRPAHAGARPGHPIQRGGRSPEWPADPAEQSTHAAPMVSTQFGRAAQRRRRVLTLLLLVLGATVAGSLAGVLATGWVVAVSVLLGVFLVLARRAAVMETRRRARARRIARLRAAQAEASRPAEDHDAATTEPRKRVAVLDVPPPAEPLDPNAWQPVPVPLPTYLTKAKAAPPVARKIDLSSPGAWTSGRLNPAGSIAMPPPKPALPEGEPEDQDLADLPEHRRAVGD